jgi:hypothetical protein
MKSQRRTSIKRTPVKRVNAARKKREFARAYHSKERVAFVKGMRCICATTMCSPCIDNAHIAGGGMGRKGAYLNIVPLCRYHHRMLHEKGVVWFEDVYALDLQDEADVTESAWLDYSGEPR